MRPLWQGAAQEVCLIALEQGNRHGTPRHQPTCPFCTYTETDTVIYDDGVCFAVVSTNPINRHHVIVAPREHYTELATTPDDIAGALLRVAMLLSRAVRRVAQPDAITHVSEDDFTGGFNMEPHTKIHVIPRFRADMHVIDWSPLRRPATTDERQQLAEEIRREVSA
jgi:diadenosine tetraphosphate (Ap4A) HIT family hydrolase